MGSSKLATAEPRGQEIGGPQPSIVGTVPNYRSVAGTHSGIAILSGFWNIKDKGGLPRLGPELQKLSQHGKKRQVDDKILTRRTSDSL